MVDDAAIHILTFNKKEFKLNANRPLEDRCMSKFEQFREGPCVSGGAGVPQVNKFEHVWLSGGQGGGGGPHVTYD